MWRRAEPFLDSLVILLATAALIRPLFKARYLAYWGSIESTFIADARFLIENWPHPQWQPLWYAGTRFDYIYPPAIRYGTAITSMIFGYAPVKAYHVYAALLYCLGIVGVYFLIRTGMRSRGAAWLGAAATALASPAFLFIKVIRQDASWLAPQRLEVLVKYGEGPHISSVALLPFALAFIWRALERRTSVDLALASVFCAAVVSHNFYGATSLAMFYPILVWSVWLTRPKPGIWWRAAAIPVLAYGLTAFWLTPSYFKVTTANMKLVALPGNAWSASIGLVAGALFVCATWRWARGRADLAWPLFVCASASVFALTVIGVYTVGFRIYGDTTRLVPELDLALILAALLGAAALWNRGGIAGRVAAALLVFAALAPSITYVRHAWSIFPVSPTYQDRVEYKIPEWFWKNMPDARVYTIGSVRFWFDTWHDLAELGGGSEQGLLNAGLEGPQWEIKLGPDPKLSLLWLQSLGVDAVYVSDKRSEEVYHDFPNPEKFAGVLPVVYDDGNGNAVYRVPRRYASRARVVETARLEAAIAPRSLTDGDALRAYVGAIENGPASPAKLSRNGPDGMRMRAQLKPGQSLLVQESYDPAWHAWSQGRPLPIHSDAMGFMRIDAPAGLQDISLVFITPLENQIGRAVTMVSILCVMALFAAGAAKRRRQSL